LKIGRKTHPDVARAWVEEGWKQEKADRRSQIIAALEVGLSVDDEEFLDTALKDKSQVVRAEAASLLAQLPGSAFAKRIRERAAAWMSYIAPAGGAWSRLKSALTRPSIGKLRVELPKKWDPAWAADGIREKPPGGIGKRAYWFAQALALVPPTYWEEQFGAKPTIIIKAARETDFGREIVDALTAAAVLHDARGWLVPLLFDWLDHDERRVLSTDAPSSLIDRMTQEDLEALALGALQPGSKRPQLFYPILQAIRGTWSDGLGEAVFNKLQREVRLPASIRHESRQMYIDVLPLAAVGLPNAFVDKALAFPDAPDSDDYYERRWKRSLERFKESLAVRKRFLEEIHRG
jgi:hypothetical protein